MQRIAAGIVGVLLLATAALKAHGLGVSPVSAMGLLAAAWFQVCLVVGEVLLGVWLLSGAAPLGSWSLAVAVFTVFSGFSLYQGIVGYSACGCFGRLHVSPWYAFGLDVAVLAGLAVGRPRSKVPWANFGTLAKEAIIPVLCVLAGVTIMAGALVATAQLAFGSVPAAVAYLRGDRVSVNPTILDLGSGEVGEFREGSITITNWADKPIRVFGGTTGCSCTVLADLPVSIPPMESRALTVRSALRGSPGVFTRQAGFLVDDGGFRRVEFAITGQVRHPARDP